MSADDSSNRPRPLTNAGVREAIDRAFASMDSFVMRPDRLFHPASVTAEQVAELQRLAGEPSEEETLAVWFRCFACGHRLAYAATRCPQCETELDDRDPPSVFPERCTCRRCCAARLVEAS